MADLVTDNVWLGLAAWMALYISDYMLTLKGARLYRKHAQEKFVYRGSYELTPYFQEDIDSLRVLSPRFFVALTRGGLLLALVWWMTRRSGWTEAYLFVLGVLIIPELAVHVRHFGNLTVFKAAGDDSRSSGGSSTPGN